MVTSESQIAATTECAGCVYQFGRFTLQVAADGNTTLVSDGHPVGLTAGELTILRVLIENRGQFIKTKVLLECVTQSPRASENVVHGAVRELRRTLHDAELIKTERTKGYCFTGGVTLRAEDSETSSGIDAPTSSDVVEPATKDRPRDTFLVVSLLVSAAVLMLPFGLAFAAGSWRSVSKQLSFIQALMILVAIGYDFFLTSTPQLIDGDTETRRGLIAVQQLRRAWRLLLTSWCFLYVTLLVSQGLALSTGDATSQSQALRVITTLLNNASALMLVLCYLVLNRPTVVQIGGRNEDHLPLGRGLILVGLFGLLEAALVIYFATTGHADYAAAVLFGVDVLSGIAGGIAMALFISRLDSRLLGASRWLPIIPIILYFYVVIQPFYPLLNWTFPLGRQVPEHFDLWVMQLAFMLKSVMYIYVTELFKSKRFQFYMVFARRAYEDVENQWSAFKTEEQ
jgi:DNA-binding winged helix-turn-helix (wHTH) protein